MVNLTLVAIATFWLSLISTAPGCCPGGSVVVLPFSESESDHISSSHIRLIRCLAVIGQASCTREHLV